MTTDIGSRPSTVKFGPDVILGRRRSRAFSAQQDPRETEVFRKQSSKYQLPKALSMDDDKSDVDETTISETDIRRNVFGKPLSEMHFAGSDHTVRRYTVASARRSVAWSRERRLYEDKNRKSIEEFKDQPYMKHKFPSLSKHYPGTWRIARQDQIEETTDRLYHSPAPTAASTHLHNFQCFLHNVLEIEQKRQKQEELMSGRPRTSTFKPVPIIKKRPGTSVSIFQSNFSRMF